MLCETTFWNIRYILSVFFFNKTEQCENIDAKCCIRTIFEQYFGATEHILKPSTIACAFWGYLERCACSLSCWEKKTNKDVKWFILAFFEMMFRKLELQRKGWRNRRLMVHSDNIWNDVIEVGNAEKKLKMGWILTLFTRMFWKLELTIFFLKNRRLRLFCSKKKLTFLNSWHPNLVCSRSGIRRTKPRHPEYLLKWSGIWRTKRGVGGHPHLFIKINTNTKLARQIYFI